MMVIGFQYYKLNLIVLTQNFNIKYFVYNLMKHAAIDKEAAWPYNPFPIEPLHHYVNRPSTNAIKQIWKRDCAIIALELWGLIGNLLFDAHNIYIKEKEKKVKKNNKLL